MPVNGPVGTSLTDRPEFSADLDGYWVTGSFTVDQDRLRLTELRIKVLAAGAEPGAEISATWLRELHLAELVSGAKRALAHQAGFFADRPDRYSDETIRLARRRIKAARRRTPTGTARGRGDAFYRGIALAFIELVESGRPTPGGVLETLAASEGKRIGRDVPLQTLRTWLRIARQRQFLAPGERGRLVAIPGPHLYDLSEES